MRFAMVIVEAEEDREAISDAEHEFDALVRRWADLRLRVRVIASGRLAPKRTARTVPGVTRSRSSPMVHFIEAKESIAGILIVDVESDSEAIDLAKAG